MKWYEKFKVGQRVRVVKKVVRWRYDNYSGDGYTGRGASWVVDMDGSIGKVYKIIDIDSDVGYLLEPDKRAFNQGGYWYPVEALRGLVGEQLTFSFYE